MRLHKLLLPALALTSLTFAAPTQSPQKASDKDAYVVVDKDGHFTLNGNRIRFWSCVGGFTMFLEGRSAYADIDLIANRLKELGFNPTSRRQTDTSPR